MAFTDSNFRQECPNCGYNDGNNFRVEELCFLRPPYTSDPGDLTTCEVAERKRYPVCRKCGFVVGLETEDEMQREALAYAARLFGSLDDEPSFEMESEAEDPATPVAAETAPASGGARVYEAPRRRGAK